GTATYTVLQSDIDAGLDIVNVATVTSEEDATDNATETVEVNGATSVDITKVVVSNDDELGGEVNFAIEVTNTGNVTLYDIYVEDNVTGESWVIPSLSPAAQDVKTITVVITQEMIDEECYVNTATAEIREYLEGEQNPGQGGEGEEYRVVLSDTSQEARACFTQGPALTLDKQIVGEDTYEVVGDVISYQYVITNTGNVTLQGPIQVIDDKIADIEALAGPLAVGQSVTATASYTVTAADIIAKEVTNVASATASFEGEPVTSNQNSETAEAILLILNEIDTYCELDAPYIRWDLSGINLELLDSEVGPNPITMTWYDKDGNVVVVYGNLPFEGTMLFPGAAVDENGYGTQWPGWKYENMQWVAGEFNYYQVREEGAYVIFSLNPEVSAEVTYPGATEACNPNPNPPLAVDDDMTAIPVYSELGYSDIVNVLDNDQLGDLIGLNTTLVTVTEVAQSTPGALILDTATGLVSVSTGLAPGIYTLEYRICTNPNPTNCDTAIVTVRVVSPGVAIEKTVLENDNELEGFVTYEIKVTNTGDVELTGIEVSDDLTGDTWTIASLAPGATWTETAQLEIDQELIDGGCVTNTATAVVYLGGDSESGEERTVLVRAVDSVEACFEQNPSIELLKEGIFNDENQDGFGNAGETITYAFTVTNDGNLTLTDITIEDDKVAVVGGPIATLAPGASDNTTFTASYMLTQEDIDNGFVINQALVRGEAPGGDPGDPSDDITDESSDPTPVEEPSTECTTCTETELPQNPAIQVVKTDNGAEV
ncbi:DUF7507 domain-containing protein, partial [Algoriphagus terrigena]|uniref:DUF7507 domain-containing protein n=1 Tax=Algoriphagus terrigena TaxID=344884 RepID=UPI00054D4E82